MHRFEVLFTVLLLAAVAGGVWWVSSQITGLGITGTCWPRDVNGNFPNSVCESLMGRFWEINDGVASYPRIGLVLVGPIAGLILGVPVVAREIELRTTDLAWSLALRRGRWLIARLLPMLLLAVLGLGLLGYLGSLFFDALKVGGEPPHIHEVGSQGYTLVARGVMGLGIALLVGAIIGRTLPALLVSAILTLAWGVIVVPTIAAAMERSYAVWQRPDAWRQGIGYLAILDADTFDVTKTGVNGEPGARIVDDAQFLALVITQCGPEPTDSDTETTGSEGWYACQSDFLDQHRFVLVVPTTAFPAFQLADAAASLAVGSLAIILTFSVVGRRRPS
jgi:hypothetical protein